MATAESVKSKIQGLINKSNETTGNADTDLTSAVNSLVEGYGKGGGEQPTLFAPIVTEGTNSISWRNDTNNGGFAVSILATIDGETVTSPLTVTEDMSDKTLIITAKSENFIDGVKNVNIFYSVVDPVDPSLIDVILPNATVIAANSFNGNKNVKTVTAPNVMVIEEMAFLGSTIETITADKLTSIERYAFSGCKALALTSLPSGVTNIGSHAFQQCENLSLTSLPEGVTSIEERTFYNCNNLALTHLPDGITNIGTYAFGGCSNLALTVLPSGVTSIGAYAFSGCKNLKKITFKGTPNSIASNAFNNCSYLGTINVPWANGAVAGAPWGATSATINYNYKGD